MYKLALFFFSIFISINSFAQWDYVTKSFFGKAYYVDLETVTKSDGLVSWSELSDYLKPGKFDVMSVKAGVLGDCETSRIKTLNVIFYKQAMGMGQGTEYNISIDKWEKATPGTVVGRILDFICERTKIIEDT
jgi:hypothetical protein